MLKNSQVLLESHPRNTVLLVTNGFEERVPAGVSRLGHAGFRCKRVVLVRYPGPEHQESFDKVSRAAREIIKRGQDIREVPPSVESIDEQLGDLSPTHDRIVCDISGLSRVLMLRLLTRVWRRGFRMFLLYTEAKEYYPLKRDFSPFLKEASSGQAFVRLAQYEDADIVYSAKCRVEEIPELPGANFPNHPLILVSFLTFKRSRLSAVLNQYETNARILIEGTPVRKDLKWRRRALEIINFDLLNGNKENIVPLPTLYWETTYRYLADLYQGDSLGYRFNFILAPLGGKMQTFGAWLFAVNYPDVKVVTSTPTALFPEKYSLGFTNTHVVPIQPCAEPIT